MYCNCEERWIETKQDRNYQISSKGRVWSCYTKRLIKSQDFKRKRDIGKDIKNMYKRISLGKKRKQKSYFIHGLMMTNFLCEYNRDTIDIDHRNQIKAHNCLCNLRFLNKSDNQSNKEWSNKKGNIDARTIKGKEYVYFRHTIDKVEIRKKCETKKEARDLQDCYICIQDMKEQVFSLYQDDLLSLHS